MKTAKIIGVGHVNVGRGYDAQTVIFHFYADGRIVSKVRGDREFTEWCGEPVLLESLLIKDYPLFEKYFSAWDD